MSKADLLDDIRYEVGLKSDKSRRLEPVYAFICKTMVEMMTDYESVSIYMAQTSAFIRMYHSGSHLLRKDIPYGDSLLSLAAVRGNVVREMKDTVTEVYVPFYHGHHLIGVLVVVSIPLGRIDDEDVTLFCEIRSLLETRLKEMNN
ncbi:hypothetical protein IC619_006945 [Hazenella sp. IB182353]|uniref:hypothetical protein n=1 Tax=Polycladospora coralii TaxID=2771432 RepID=UPI0017478070|nr:hypothetical protein [Polycladospora coralii]MBS7530228.1 hypothetical protein [Polycladospora coralii]